MLKCGGAEGGHNLQEGEKARAGASCDQLETLSWAQVRVELSPRCNGDPQLWEAHRTNYREAAWPAEIALARNAHCICTYTRTE